MNKTFTRKKNKQIKNVHAKKISNEVIKHNKATTKQKKNHHKTKKIITTKARHSQPLPGGANILPDRGWARRGVADRQTDRRTWINKVSPGRRGWKEQDATDEHTRIIHLFRPRLALPPTPSLPTHRPAVSPLHIPRHAHHSSHGESTS